MAGNVWEWTNDWYRSEYYSEPSVDPQGPSTGTARMFRGGSWYGTSAEVRSVNREISYVNNPMNPDNDMGFRCARTP